MGSKQRDRLWPIFAGARQSLRERGFITPAQIFSEVSAHYAGRAEKPFTHIVVDEAQDLGVPNCGSSPLSRLAAATACSSPATVHECGIEKIDAEIRRFMKRFHRLGVDLALPHPAADSPRPESDF